MKAMLMIDALVCKPSFVGQILISLFVGLMLAIGFENIYMIIPTVACTAAVTSMFNLIALDENNDWEAYRLSLPLSRTQIIQGRYASALMITLAYTAVGLVLFALLALIASGLSGLGEFAQTLAAQAADLTWQSLAVMTAFPVCFMLLFSGVAYPLVARFGLTKGVRWLPMVIVLLPLLAGFVGYLGIGETPSGENALPGTITSLIAWLNTPEGVTLALLGLIAVSALVFIGSYFLAAKLYQKREF